MKDSVVGKLMDGLSVSMIETRIVYGFAGAGKTTYISDCIQNDYFYRYGTTLILCFEQGEKLYDEEMLRSRNTNVVYYQGGRDAAQTESFCTEQIGNFIPDRIYVEMCTNLPKLRDSFPAVMNVISAVTFLSWPSLEALFQVRRQTIRAMVAESQQVTFRGCPSKELLAPYSEPFRLMNHRASYLRQDPMGYHEKAFDLFVPYELSAPEISISASEYLVFWLDAADHPAHYEGKRIRFTDPLETRHVAGEHAWFAGRVVMTCCMADLQFMSFELTDTDPGIVQGGWITLKAIGRVGKDAYGREILKLIPESVAPAAAPKDDAILQRERRLSRLASVSLEGMFQRMKNRQPAVRR